MSGGAQVASVLEAGGPELRRRLELTERRLAEVASSHGAELAGHVSGTLSAGGKRLRPVLVFLCGGPDRDGLLEAAVAVELLHMATLVHDDVLDQAPLRRGTATVFANGGRRAATATGDLLFSRAFAELVSTGSEAAVDALSAASSSLARGELMQRADAWADDVRPERYLERCELKTASLFSAACRLGALLGDAGTGADATATGAGAEATLAGFGRRIGLAFQILDDVLDVSGPSERTGKHRGTDLLDGTVTLPLIIARRRDPVLRGMDLRSLASEPSGAEAVCDRIADTGALDEARGQALRHVAEAKAALSGVALPRRRHEALALVADGVVERLA
jgi:geranylgeranyl pyrophosphate synthase